MSEKNTSQKKSSTPIIIGGMGVIIVLLVVLIVVMMNRGGNAEPPQAEERRNTVVTQENVEQVVDEMLTEEPVEPGYYSASMSTTWHFATGDAVSEDAYVENVRENTHDVYFDVFLEEDEENAILKSPVIPRGSEMTNIALDAPLDAGTHNCVMVYHLIDEDQNTISTLRVGLTIIVAQ